MASILDMSASSDSDDDVDYIPSTNGAASDSSFDEDVSDDEEAGGGGELSTEKLSKKKKLEQSDDNPTSKSQPAAKIDEKQRANELWERFLNDVEECVSEKKPYPNVLNENIPAAIPSEGGSKAPQTPNLTTIKPVSKVFEFAGETVIGVDKDSKSDFAAEKNSEAKVPTEKPLSCPPKRGIDSVLGTILNKNKKLNVLEKSIMDWRSFKKDEGLDHELEKVNKGKAGFVERQRFLQRSDIRSFELEKSMRQTLRKK